MRRLLVGVVGALVLGIGVGTAEATPVLFLGIDEGLGELNSLPSHPNADAARNSFLAAINSFGTENFEGFAAGQTGVTATFAEGVTAAFSGGLVRSKLGFVPAGAETNGAGRYPISGNQYIEANSGDFSLTFSRPLSAFGFYGVDIGDFQGLLNITATTVSGSSLFYQQGTPGQTGGSVLFFGFYTTDPNEAFTKITFGSTSNQDTFGVDDVTIQAAPVPEPASLLLLGTGLVAVARRFRRRQA